VILCAWRAGTGSQFWDSGMTIPTVKVQDKDLFAQGLILKDLAKMKEGDHDTAQFAAISRPGNSAQRWASDMDLDEFKAKDAEFFKNGLRLVDVSITGGFDQDIVAVWRPGTSEQRWASRSTGKKQQLEDLDKDFVAQDLRMEIVAVHR
jgi:hypothetical protein